MEDWRMREMNGKGSHGKDHNLACTLGSVQLGCCPRRCLLTAPGPWTLDVALPVAPE